MAIADTAYNKDINDKPPDELCSVIYFIFSSKEDNFYKLICEDDDFFFVLISSLLHAFLINILFIINV